MSAPKETAEVVEIVPAYDQNRATLIGVVGTPEAYSSRWQKTPVF